MKKSYGFYTVLITLLILTGNANAILSSAEKTPTPSVAVIDSQIVPEGLTTTMWSKIKSSIDRDRYRIHKDKHTGGYQAPNPVHELDAAFSREGIEVSPRKGKKGWRWGLSLARYGYGSNLQAVPAVEKMITKENRIEYHRGDMVEWYINNRRGLEQGFTLKKRPSEQKGSGLLQLQMKTKGNLKPVVKDEGKMIALLNVRGEEALRYRGLYAYDATGKALDSRMAVDKAGIRLIVNEHQAVYPIIIDPFIETKKLIASDGAIYDYFGFSVSISGDTAIVGAHWDDDNGEDSGSAYIFSRDHGGVNNWGEVKKLIASDGEIEDYFGQSVAINSDTAIVGAYQDDDSGDSSGSAYIFHRDQGGINNWGAVKKLNASDGAAIDEFGRSVSIRGDTAIVGAANDDNSNGVDAGSAYIFYRNQGGANNWGEITTLTASDGAAGDRFGIGVSICGDTAIVGAIYDDDHGTNSGSAYIFYRDQGGADNWGEVEKLTAVDGAINDYFGHSVSISGDTAIAGSHWDDDNGSGSGSAYIFSRNQGGVDMWGQVKKLTASDGAADDYFGWSVSVSEDRAIVGALFDDDYGNGSGSAYIFFRNHGGPDNWGEEEKLIPNDGDVGDFFGNSVSISGNTAIAGAHQDDDNGVWSGSAYIFKTEFGDELAADFGTNGLWHHDGTWSRMTTWNPDDGLTGWSGGIGVDFGGNGLWVNDGSSWSRITTWDAGSAGMTGWSGGLALDFDANGLWNFNGSAWNKLTNWNPDSDLTGWSGGLGVDFGTNGLWNYNGSSWSRNTTWNTGSAGLSGWSGGLAADFDVNGLWAFDGSAWSKLTNWDPEDDLTGWPGGLAVDFGVNGLWNYDGSSWHRLTTWDPGVMTGFTDGLVVEFGANGMWKYDGSSWSKLTDWNAENMSDCDLN